MSKLAFGTILVAIAAMELVYILTVTDDDGEVLFYPVTVVAAIVNLVRNLGPNSQEKKCKEKCKENCKGKCKEKCKEHSKKRGSFLVLRIHS